MKLEAGMGRARVDNQNKSIAMRRASSKNDESGLWKRQADPRTDGPTA